MRDNSQMVLDISTPDFWPGAEGVFQDHMLGHRDRLRHRVKVGGFDPLPDYELLELILFRTFPRGDVKPLAKALIQRFGGLASVFGASVAELCTVKGVGEAAAIDLQSVQAAALRIARAPVAKRTVITSWSQLIAYVRVALANQVREQFRVLFLDRKSLIHGTVLGWSQ